MVAEGEDALRLRDARVLAELREKSDSAIGVTYSCEKRTSVRAKKASPGFTAGTPILPALASTMTRAARISRRGSSGSSAS